MAVATYEGVVEKGKIRLKSDVKLPENLRVYVVVPALRAGRKKAARVPAPRLAHRKQASDFKLKVSKA